MRGGRCGGEAEDGVYHGEGGVSEAECRVDLREGGRDVEDAEVPEPGLNRRVQLRYFARQETQLVCHGSRGKEIWCLEYIRIVKTKALLNSSLKLSRGRNP